MIPEPNSLNYLGLWQNTRIKFMLELYPSNFFKNKRILELGAFDGYLGNYFRSILGADVTLVEGREEHCNNIRRNYPLLNVKNYNLDTIEWPFGKYDIIINFGLYYHLENFHKEHLINCIRHCDLMFFESVIHDSIIPKIEFKHERGNDQSLSEIGGVPTTSYVENIFKEENCKFTKYTDKKLNAYSHRYDWVENNSDVLYDFYRRFWTVTST